ncbi:lytic transglycosylase domain-containing protein, partial [bacterium]|nr:lytic transglycosylase domain-containing protein [bacterium]
MAYKSRYDVPIIINEEVIQQINYFQGNGRRHFERYLERSGRYVPMMRKILKEHGLPEDLVYLALIESGFNLKAHSRARAVGPWQFIYWTGHRYGLKVDTWVDERCDPVKATHAAAGYLKALYNEFGDWYLAMAGYNAGEGKIRNAIKRYHSRDFWTLSGEGNRYLKPETRNYVPKFIAAVLMAKNPEEFGFDHVKLQPPLEYETVEIDSQTEIKVIAKLADTSVETIESLNSELRRWATPPGDAYLL